uniref:FH2 domain-containing protein n=1 Tax=Magallana gigas TaxID=29159 RepID=A0A8W8KM33_MAGGI
MFLKSQLRIYFLFFFANRFTEFLEEDDADLEETQDVIERIRKQATRLAQHFCENEKKFNLDEFLSTFRQFCGKVKACQQELETQRQKEETEEKRRKAQEDKVDRRKVCFNPSTKTEDRKIVDNIVDEIRRGKVLRRLSSSEKEQCDGRDVAIPIAADKARFLVQWLVTIVLNLTCCCA